MSLPDEMSSSRKHQRSLKKPVSMGGIGLFTGAKTELTLRPAPEGTGILFQRMDLPNKPILAANVENVLETPRCTILGNSEFQIQTVEHILSTLKAFDLDNVIIEIDGPEVPSCDGSALAFVDMVQKAGVLSQTATKKVYHLHAPVFWSKGDVHLVALPADEFRISYTLNYPNSELLKSQFYTVHVNEETYKQEIAPARTFSLYEEVVPLIEKGNIKGGRLDNAVIIKGDSILNPEGVRYRDEMVRHKILDLIGDLSLVGDSFLAHIIAIRSGHFSNTSFAKELVNNFKMENR
ncbi:UDP-3-O-acyl-N-acetylglucosamine deacetylase [Simkania negevensis]|uniref:UDP-3-O-acyl-N-acetylglucosamine deacetylase n=1 Tax=Simkania negevensis (strain ATCC VR-1471 / DSM 27360 / Z) TaxID=331113 RepID=F8L3Y8_SIMNZ|nr:UDP-3-O-acyl-N-acetylglucosamine deacetylase [Simkania negevensis]MCB1067871.1 UDP-3-O-[3-hydroxymyristoyl] N-acetylglucosamine deacetylase [Simkania sp.]MCB1074848.1 UDP-3-O-[3-hydroxymyristoyl] N-acetylglucosamine deacetylase [Simkania sp.]MCP5489729.1 UDP-3-O-[3-hydroxymyristoyl] N-acetylglucosamine deacetylase [Chlamydiales bacterium]CCB90018.1 UDP-3-O-[3-hydroxymyristoyl] N-acetylglucosamine deacetylase [Simkania negevensis Z]